MGGKPHGHERGAGGGGLPLWAVKLFAALLMAAVCAAGSLLPVFVASHAQKSRVEPPQQQKRLSKYRMLQILLSLINCFAAGAFLGLAVIHLLPEAVLQLQRDGYLLVLHTARGEDGGSAHAYNIAYMLAAVGFTAMLALEQFLAGGHAHCHRDPSAPLEAQAEGEAAPPPLPSFANLTGCRASVESPHLLQHPSHHHAQHHLLCTSANYCPGCDDCAETATAAPAARGEAGVPAAAREGEGREGRSDARGGGHATKFCYPSRQQLALRFDRSPKEPEAASAGPHWENRKQQQPLQLSHVGEQAESPDEEALALFKQGQKSSMSRKTATTSLDCSDSMRERRRVVLCHHSAKPMEECTIEGEKKQDKAEEEAGAGVRSARQDIHAFVACTTTTAAKKLHHLWRKSISPSRGTREEQAETGDTDPDTGDPWETELTGAGKTQLKTMTAAASLETLGAATAVLAQTKSAGASVADSRERKLTKELHECSHTMPPLLMGMFSEPAQIGVNGAYCTGSGEGDASGAETERDSSRERSRRAREPHGSRSSSSNSCCRGDSHQKGNSHPIISEGEDEKGATEKRKSADAAAAATPGATGDAKTAAHNDQCACKRYQAVTITPCCCSGCCKKCKDHSHDPESSSRVHSGSIGANVQGGDSAVELQQGALNGSGRRAEDVIRGLPDDGQKDEGAGALSGEKQKEEESELQVVIVSSPPTTTLSLGPPSPRSSSMRCCWCCQRPRAPREGDGRLLLMKQHAHLHQHHSLKGTAQSRDDKQLDITEDDDYDRGDRRSRRGRLHRRLVSWIGDFDAAKWSLALALGVHAVFEGLILGTTMKSEDVWIAALAILGHKGAEGVALSSTLLRLHMGRPRFALVLGLFVLASPLGVFLGAVATNGGTGVCGVFNALAVGAVLYATNEMLSEFAGRCSRLRRVLKLLAFMLGLGMLFGLDLLHAPFCQHHHAHAHDHHHHHH